MSVKKNNNNRKQQTHQTHSSKTDLVRNGQIVGTKQERHERGNEQLRVERDIAREEFNLSWFQPSVKQKEIIESINNKACTLIDGRSGTGKSTTTIFHALRALQSGRYRKIIFIKTPTQLGVDDVGFLGTNEAKFDFPLIAMRSIFESFMSKEKLEMEEKKGRIEFMFPNWLGGQTFSHSIVIIDEMQWFNPEMVKLVLERCDASTKVVCLFDSKQRYANKQREDGANDLLNKVTIIDEETATRVVKAQENTLFGYVHLDHSENRRGALSKRITELYDNISFERNKK